MEHDNEVKPSTSSNLVEDNAVQGELSDPTSLCWRNLKMSDSEGEKKSESPIDLYKISITCSRADVDSSLEGNVKTQSDSDSPPIITEDVPPYTEQHSEEESMKSDDNNSQKSLDRTFDTSINKQNSPTSSVTSQRKLEWDSLADVGYANEADRKNSASSLSTLERLALQQQYSNSDPQINIGLPTAQSTPQDEEDKSKIKKRPKITKIHRKDVDFVEVKTSDNNPPQTLNVNLTKHISFNMDKCGEISLAAAKNNTSFTEQHMNNSPVEKQLSEEKQLLDKEIQTTLKKSTNKPENDKPENIQDQSQQVPVYGNANPVLINVNVVKKRRKLNRFKASRKKIRPKRRFNDNKDSVTLEKSGDQVSAAESFEYMPGDVYNQNQGRSGQPTTSNAAGNRSSLESSRGATTTDSSKGSKHSFSAQLEKQLILLKSTLHKRFTDYDFKKAIIKQIVQDLVKTKFYDETTTTDFLSGLSFNSKTLGLSRHSTSTSDTGEKVLKPKKSILRDVKSSSHEITSTSHSVPNLVKLPKNNKPVPVRHSNRTDLSTSDTDASRKNKNSRQIDDSKLSSEELYRKYIEALQREKARKTYLKEKESFLRQKLCSSENVLNLPVNVDKKVESNLRDLMNDLIRNNYSDGSGDANKIESSPGFLLGTRDSNAFDQKARSIFTVSSSNSESNVQSSLNKNKECNQKESDGIPNTKHYCCCPYHHENVYNIQQYVVAKENKNTAMNNLDLQMDKTTHGQQELVTKSNNSPKLKSGDSNLPNDFIKKCLCKLLPLQANFSDNLCDKGTDVIQSQELLLSTARSKIIPLPSSTRSKSTQYDKVISEDLSESTVKTTRSCQTNIKVKLITESIDKCVSTVPMDVTLNNRIIRESTRYVQTEMSVNPKVTEPTLNDIKIINDSDCVNLVSNNTRTISTDRKQFKNKKEGISAQILLSNGERSCVQKENEIIIITPVNVQVVESSTTELESKNELNKQCNTASSSSANFVIDTGLKPQSENDIYNVNPRHIEVETLYQVSSNKLESTEPSKQELLEITSNELKQKSIRRSFTDSSLLTNKIESVKNSEHKTQSLTDQSKCKCRKLKCGGQCRDISQEEFKYSSSDKNYFEYSKVPKTNYTVSIDKTMNINTFTHSNSGCSNLFQNKAFYDDSKRSETLLNISNEFQQQPSATTFTTQSLKNKISHFDSYNQLTKMDNVNYPEKHLLESYDKKCIEIYKRNDKSMDDDTDGGTHLRKNNTTPESGSACSSFSTKFYSNYQPPSTEESSNCKDILDVVQDITKRYTKKGIKKNQKRKCFKEIMKLLNYLLDTEDLQDDNKNVSDDSKGYIDSFSENNEALCNSIPKVHKNENDFTKKNYKNNAKLKTPVDNFDSNISDKNNGKQVSSKLKTKQSEIRTDTEFKKDKAFADEASLKEIKKTNTRDAQCSTENNTDILEKKKSHTAQGFTQKKSDGVEKNKSQSNSKMVVDKGIQISHNKPKTNYIESSENTVSTDGPYRSSDNAACRTFSRIRKECDNYHRKRCSGHKRCECSSSTSLSCEICRCSHYCFCRKHKHRSHKGAHEVEFSKKKCVAYNLILQSSDSMTFDDSLQNIENPLKNIVIKVPNNQFLSKLPFNEVSAKIEGKINGRTPFNTLENRKSSDDKCKSNEENVTPNVYTIRDYLERNRPNFIEKCAKRQERLKIINQTRAGERATQEQVLRMQVQMQPSSLNDLSETDLMRLASHLGIDFRRKKVDQKIISEREMKKHSEKIYKTLPEVRKKKEDAKKESIKKTNLLLANIFKKNLQKKVLRGSVNLSNYSAVVKI